MGSYINSKPALVNTQSLVVGGSDMAGRPVEEALCEYEAILRVDVLATPVLITEERKFIQI